MSGSAGTIHALQGHRGLPTPVPRPTGSAAIRPVSQGQPRASLGTHRASVGTRPSTLRHGSTIHGPHRCPCRTYVRTLTGGWDRPARSRGADRDRRPGVRAADRHGSGRAAPTGGPGGLPLRGRAAPPRRWSNRARQLAVRPHHPDRARRPRPPPASRCPTGGRRAAARRPASRPLDGSRSCRGRAGTTATFPARPRSPFASAGLGADPAARAPGRARRTVVSRRLPRQITRPERV